MANGFNDVGFLGDDLDGWGNTVRAEFPVSFSIADRMNRIGMRMIHDFPDGELPEHRVLAIAAFYRALQSFQSAILLSERGALAEARALARLCCEAVIVTGGLLKVDGTLEKLQEDNAKHRRSLANKMIEMNKAMNSGIDLTRFEQEVAAVNAKYPNKPHSINFADLARDAGLPQLYELSYRFPSGDGAHVTLGALHRHFKRDEQENFVGMIFHPDKSDLRSTLLAANAAIVHLLGLAQELMGLNDYEAELRDLLLQWAVTRDELGLQ